MVEWLIDPHINLHDGIVQLGIYLNLKTQRNFTLNVPVLKLLMEIEDEKLNEKRFRGRELIAKRNTE